MINIKVYDISMSLNWILKELIFEYMVKSSDVDSWSIDSY